jgi:glycosyltransferase involved in cell wall biosynthesis
VRFSFIIPSFNQPDYIGETLQNLVTLRKKANERGIDVELLLFDSESGSRVSEIIGKFAGEFDYVEIKKDQGQFDAINKGISRLTGDFWTWLNTDDKMDVDGFIRLASDLKENNTIDYVYGNVDHIDEHGKKIRTCTAYEINQKFLVRRDPAIFQQGSFFRTSFTKKIGLLLPFRCCFDYEFVLRCLSNGARMKVVDYKLADFRLYNASKTGAMTPVFIREQLKISAMYGRKPWHFLTWFSYIRLLKHRLFPRR